MELLENKFEPTRYNKFFGPYEHTIWVNVEDTCGIKFPEGYEYIGEKNIKCTNNGKPVLVKCYFLENSISVNASLYINSKTGEKAYPYAGTPLRYEKRPAKQITKRV